MKEKINMLPTYNFIFSIFCILLYAKYAWWSIFCILFIIIVHIQHLKLHTAAYYFKYYACFAYYNMRNMKNIHGEVLFCILFCIQCILNCISSIFFTYYVYFAYCNMLNMQNILIHMHSPLCWWKTRIMSRRRACTTTATRQSRRSTRTRKNRWKETLLNPPELQTTCTSTCSGHQEFTRATHHRSGGRADPGRTTHYPTTRSYQVPSNQ